MLIAMMLTHKCVDGCNNNSNLCCYFERVRSRAGFKTTHPTDIFSAAKVGENVIKETYTGRKSIIK